mmetsp:Transcript_49243/g.94046  ORF Transcript_49243/g.94046 Transcript_49243/m.94046 type:complete len:81 (+) Transcript_49243:263-505(+)
MLLLLALLANIAYSKIDLGLKLNVLCGLSHLKVEEVGTLIPGGCLPWHPTSKPKKHDSESHRQGHHRTSRRFRTGTSALN